MCDFQKGFILCTCTPENEDVPPKKRRKKHKKKPEKPSQTVVYTWMLFRHIGPVLEKEVGRYLFPLQDIGQGLTADFVLSALNQKNCFDFAYTPLENDNLVFKAKNYGRLEFIYRKGTWVEDHYCPFDHIIEKINQGNIVPLAKHP